jgi:tRNA (mo5U34)-methyltransferase
MTGVRTQAENGWTAARVRERLAHLGPWFHNLNLCGIDTAPNHFLGNFPTVKWQRFRHSLPEDLSGKTVLDIGCNAGFYSFELKRRGATRVLGIDSDESYLTQARFAAEVLNVDIEFKRMTVYDVAILGERFDIVLFLGVLYHLRYPLLALDLIRKFVAGDLVLCQSMLRGEENVASIDDNYDFWETGLFQQTGAPRLHFIEKAFADDATNWWIPNRACMEAMLRSAGFAIVDRPEDEVYLCRCVSTDGTFQ